MSEISVIIPIYNAEKTIRGCIDSVLTQSFRNYELILVNDGSTDLSGQICDEYARKDERIKVVHKENGGVSSARNTGLEMASSKWITFIDSDDTIGEHFFQDVTDSQEDLLVRGYIMSTAENQIVSELILDYLIPQPSLSEFVSMFIGFPLLRGPVLKFYKKEIISNLRFPEDMKVGEDTYFVWHYLSRSSSYKILYYYYYYIVSEVSSQIKYQSDTNYAIRSLCHLRDAFEELNKVHGISKAHFLQFIGYFKSISKQEWKKKRSLWYGNKEVRSLYSYVWADLSFMSRMRLLASFILRK